MLLLQNNQSLTTVTDFRKLRYGDVENIYQSIKIDLWPIYSVAILLALLFTFLNIFNAAQKDMSGSKDMDIGAFFNLLKEKWRFMFVILTMPLVFSLFEGLFGLISDEFIQQFQEPNANLYDALKKQIDVMAQQESTTTGYFGLKPLELVADGVDYLIVLIMQPAIVFYIESTYSAALISRFFFLFCIELTAGIAFACLLNPKTEQLFYSWVKALLISYLLIPAFLFVNVFTNEIYGFMTTVGDYSWLFPLLILIAGIKTSLYLSVPVIFNRIL